MHLTDTGKESHISSWVLSLRDYACSRGCYCTRVHKGSGKCTQWAKDMTAQVARRETGEGTRMEQERREWQCISLKCIICMEYETMKIVYRLNVVLLKIIRYYIEYCLWVFFKAIQGLLTFDPCIFILPGDMGRAYVRKEPKNNFCHFSLFPDLNKLLSHPWELHFETNSFL